MARAPFETMNLTSSSSEIEGSGAQIEALRELGGNDRTRKKTSSNFEETERGRKGDKPCPGCAKNGGCWPFALIGEMAGAFVLAIGLCSGHPRQAFGGDVPTPCAGIRTAPRRLASLRRTPGRRASSPPAAPRPRMARGWSRRLSISGHNGRRFGGRQGLLKLEPSRRHQCSGPRKAPMPAAPINLSDDEMNLLMNLAQPLDPALRPQFLEAVAQELEATRQAGEIGERSVHRLARQIQRKYWDTAAAAGRGNARLKGEVQSWNTTGEAAIIGRRASGLFRIGQRWGHNLPPRKHRWAWPGCSWC